MDSCVGAGPTPSSPARAERQQVLSIVSAAAAILLTVQVRAATAPPPTALVAPRPPPSPHPHAATGRDPDAPEERMVAQPHQHGARLLLVGEPAAGFASFERRPAARRRLSSPVALSALTGGLHAAGHAALQV